MPHPLQRLVPLLCAVRVCYYVSPFTHPLFKTSELIRSQRVCLGYDWNDIHELVQFLHELDINGSQPTRMHTGGGVGGEA